MKKWQIVLKAVQSLERKNGTVLYADDNAPEFVITRQMFISENKGGRKRKIKASATEMSMFYDYKNGMSYETISKKYGYSYANTLYHIKRVRKYNELS